ncbi:TPA: hypothetical protein RJR39_003058 [Burkholderia cenocepacia]|nr:hypothetical protein [Burkholderia cenocepacia]MBR8196005.1 hypothetical protein [Burkholderia cenocepacia]HDV6326978.1 hypothetical protein [Burkholderia cenocepacia]HDV6353512.1 hypothetical protein [Burkholderia cenocepacia]
MSFVTIALPPLHVRHALPHARQRAKPAGIERRSVEVGFLHRLRKWTMHE